MNIPRTLLPFSYLFPPLPSFLLLFPQLPFGAHRARTCTRGASPIYRFPAQEDSVEIKHIIILIAITQKKVSNTVRCSRFFKTVIQQSETSAALVRVK